MKTRAYHQAGHTVVARALGFPVEWATIADGVNEQKAVKTTMLKDVFDEDALLLGTLKPVGKESVDPEDYDQFYNLILQRIGGFVAVELAGRQTDLKEEYPHLEEDRAFAINILTHVEGRKARKQYERILGIANRILEKRWEEVEEIKDKLLQEKTVYFN